MLRTGVHLLSIDTIKALKGPVHPKSKIHIVPLTSSAINFSTLFWCDLQSCRDIGRREFQVCANHARSISLHYKSMNKNIIDESVLCNTVCFISLAHLPSHLQRPPSLSLNSLFTQHSPFEVICLSSHSLYLRACCCIMEERSA